MRTPRLASSINKLAKALEKNRKAKLKARSGWDWLNEWRELYIKQYNQPDDFTIENEICSMNKSALEFSKAYLTENSRSMNPDTRKAIKDFLKGIEKNLESQ